MRPTAITCRSPLVSEKSRRSNLFAKKHKPRRLSEQPNRSDPLRAKGQHRRAVVFPGVRERVRAEPHKSPPRVRNARHGPTVGTPAGPITPLIPPIR
jgi:hypothetical protein